MISTNMSMPSASTTSAAAISETAAEVTPYQAYFTKLNAFKDNNPKILGPMIIRGISKSRNAGSDDDDSDEMEEEEEDSDEEDEDTSKYTAEQMSSLRYIMITKRRSDLLDETRQLILGDQANHSIMMFNTSFSYAVLDGFYHFKKEYGKAKSPELKFDELLAYTYILQEYDVWMHDNEGGMDGMVKDLAGMWKRLLKNDDDKLGIDAEYTRPGVMQLLVDFKKKVEDNYSEPPFKFNFQ